MSPRRPSPLVAEGGIWTLIAVPCSWVAALATISGGLEGRSRFVVLSVVVYLVAMAPVFPLIRAVWKGRADIRRAARLATYGLGSGLLSVAALPFLDANAPGFIALLLLLIGLGYLAACRLGGVSVVWDRMALSVAAGTGITGLWLGLKTDFDPVWGILGFLTYGLGTSVAVLGELGRTGPRS